MNVLGLVATLECILCTLQCLWVQVCHALCSVLFYSDSPDFGGNRTIPRCMLYVTTVQYVCTQVQRSYTDSTVRCVLHSTVLRCA